MSTRSNGRPRSEFARRFIEVGRAEGEASAILGFLAARGIEVPDDIRERILACDDPAELQAWINRSATVHDASELFAA